MSNGTQLAAKQRLQRQIKCINFNISPRVGVSASDLETKKLKLLPSRTITVGLSVRIYYFMACFYGTEVLQFLTRHVD